MKQAHVGAIMDSYNLISGVHATQNGYINTEIVRKQWGFDGIMMSDWRATYDGVAAANGGLDLDCKIWRAPAGTYKVLVGKASDDIDLTGEIKRAQTVTEQP